MFTEKRARVILKELERLIPVQTIPLAQFETKPGFFLTPSEADADSSPFTPFSCQSDTWNGPDAHYWFKTSLTVPESFGGKSLFFSFSTQKAYWDAVNPQFLFFLNGSDTPLQGVDVNHREVLITQSAVAGETLRIDLQAYTGRDTDEHQGESFALRLFATVTQRDPEIEALTYNLSVPCEIAEWLPTESLSRFKLLEAITETVNRIDLREPYSEAFFASVKEANAYAEQAIFEDLAGNDEVIASCVGHTHIDVAWWWTVAQTREKAARSFATALKLMDEYPDYRFMSSQPQLYAFVKERYPGLYEKIKERISEGRWEAEGGMWLEADCNLISGESMVRQFLHGKRFFMEEFGKDNRILWLPDVFGYSAALPQILKKSGIDYFMTTKIAWNQFNKLPMDTFWWKGIDGSEVFTHLITTQDAHQAKDSHYTTYNGFLNATSVMRAWERYQQKAVNNDVLLSCGYGDGGGGTTRAMCENASRLSKGITGAPKVRWETSLPYFEALSARCAGDKRLPRWSGELYLEYHRGTYTSMARNKKGNRKSELLWQEAEFFSVWAERLGLPYPAKEMDESWKTILLNQFHDILPGSSIREVYEVTKAEYAMLIDKAQEIIAKATKLLADHSGGAAGSLVIFNSLSFPRSAIVPVPEGTRALKGGDGNVYPVQQTPEGLVCRVENLPAQGFGIYNSFIPAEPFTQRPFILGDDGIETPFLRVSWNAQRQFTSLYDKEAHRELLKPGCLGNVLMAYEDKPMNYDNWDVDIYYTEKRFELSDVESAQWIEDGPIRATLRVRRKFLHSIIEQDIRFYANDRRIDFDTFIDWKQHQILLKTEFDLDINANEATYDIQFGNLTRPTHANTSWDMAKFEVCAHKWADLSEGDYGVALLNDCKYGHAIHDGKMTLTLLKSGILPNPVSDQEEHSFTYSLLPHLHGWKDGKVVEEAYCLNVPVRTAQVSDKEEGETSRRVGQALCPSFLTLERGSVILETVKRAEDGVGMILRLFEYANSRCSGTITTPYPIARVTECDLMERPLSEVKTDTTSFRFEARPYEIKTFRVELAK